MSTAELQRMLYSLVADVVAGDRSGRTLAQLVADLVQGTGLAAAKATSEAVDTVAAPRPADEGPVETAASLLARHMAELAGVSRNQTETIEANTRAVIENSLARATEGKASTAGSVAKTVFSFLGSGLGLVRLFGSLFGGNRGAPEPELTRFVLPAPVQLGAALTPAGLQPLRYGQDGLPRAATAERQTPITIEVHAIDSRSFLDHSFEIAKAVKEALLQSHSLNDVVSDL